MGEKQDIILMHIREGKSQREIHKLTGLSRDTIRRYINNYEEKLRELGGVSGEINRTDLIEDLTSNPKCKSTSRIKKAVTEEVLERLRTFIKENEFMRLKGMSKQQKKKKDMYEALKNEGFEVSYPSVVNAVNSIERRKKEAFIKQEYAPGDVVEFDFGLVKIFEKGALKEYQLAVFTSAYGNYRWAKLFPKQDTQCFLESHALFFKDIQGAYKTVVYDNTKVAVKKFIGHCEKEPTEALLKLSLYYKFRFRFCNAYSGWEKGHVERSVEVVRRKAFNDPNLIIESLKEANSHLEKVLDTLNRESLTKGKKSPSEALDEERAYLLPDMPLYETATIGDYRVNKYSAIMIDSSYYSVPDTYVEMLVRCKIYTSKILVFYGNEKIAEHDRIRGFNQWVLDIKHYSNTLFKKPHALINSTVFSKVDEEVKGIYTRYFQNKEKEFINVLKLIGDYGIEAVENSINKLLEICPQNISSDKIQFICERKEDDKVLFLSDYKSEILDNSLKMMEEYNKLLENGGRFD